MLRGPSVSQSTHNPLSIATAALEAGYAPLPLPLRSKAPELREWQHLKYESTRHLEQVFDREVNVGLILGQASNGLVDVDLDCEEARRLAGSFLPHTPMRHGRASSPESHYWYRVDAEVATHRWADPITKETLLEIRSTGAQTVIPPSIHPSGEALEWSEGWKPPREVPSRRLVMHVRVLAAATLLARYWPAAGARHDASLALAGGLLRSGWSERNAVHLVVEVALAAGDEEGRDRAADVSTTARRLSQNRDTVGWRTLASYLGHPVVESVRELLDLGEEEDEETDELEEAQGELRNRTDIGELLREGVPPPDFLLPSIFYRRAIHWWHGEPGDGKTLLMLALSLQVMQRGHRVMLLDEESGAAQTAYRLQAMGADPDLITERLLYYQRPSIDMSPEDLDALFRTVAEERPSLVIIDSVADALGQAQLDEDSNVEVTRWAKQVLEPLKFAYKCSVVAIDHVTKSKDTRGKYARGAGAKKSKADAAWKVVKVDDFATDRVGLIRIEADKDRDGWLPARIGWRIGGRNGAFVFEPIDAVTATGNAVPEGELERRIVEYLSLNAEGEVDAVATRIVEQEVQGRREDLREALESLASMPETGVRHSTQGRGRRWWYSTHGGDLELDFRVVDD